MAWLKEVWGSWFENPPAVDGRDMDRISEMLDYLRDDPYVPAPGRRG